MSKPQTSEGHQFFDPRTPEIPTEVLGIPTKPLRELGKALGAIAFIDSSKTPYPFVTYGYHASYSTDKALTLFPLIERIQAGEDIRPEDVRPYRKPIKRLVSKLNTADRFAALSGAVGLGIPIRRAINRRVEEEFPQRVGPLLEKAGSYLPQVEPYVDFIGQFENPRQQFVSEVSIVTGGIRHQALQRAQRRGNSNIVTAEDAAEAIRRTIDSILADRQGAKEELPMFSHFLIEHLPEDVALPPSDILGVVAPEIIGALEAALPKDKRDGRFLDSILSHPHPKRWLAERFKARQIEYVREVASLLFPSVRDLLPANGQEVRDTFEKLKNFLEVSPEKATSSVINPDDALKFYKDGVVRFRKPKPRFIGKGRDANSYDFRGVGAAMNVISTFPYEIDSEGHRTPADLQKVKAHMDAGLIAIKKAGRLPLTSDFVQGYQRMANLFARPKDST